MDGEVEFAERVVAMKRTQFSIKDLLNQSEAKPEREAPAASPPPLPDTENGAAAAADTLPSLDDLTPLPRPGDPYQASARASNKPLPTLILVQANADELGFSYANLERIDRVAGHEPGQGPQIRLRFCGMVNEEVRIGGRHLEKLYSQLGQHRVWWVREQSPSREFLPETVTVITSITISKVQG